VNRKRRKAAIASIVLSSLRLATNKGAEEPVQQSRNTFSAVAGDPLPGSSSADLSSQGSLSHRPTMVNNTTNHPLALPK